MRKVPAWRQGRYLFCFAFSAEKKAEAKPVAARAAGKPQKILFEARLNKKPRF